MSLHHKNEIFYSNIASIKKVSKRLKEH